MANDKYGRPMIEQKGAGLYDTEDVLSGSSGVQGFDDPIPRQTKRSWREPVRGWGSCRRRAGHPGRRGGDD